MERISWILPFIFCCACDKPVNQDSSSAPAEHADTMEAVQDLELVLEEKLDEFR